MGRSSVSINSTSYKRSDAVVVVKMVSHRAFPLIPLLIKEAILAEDAGLPQLFVEFPLIPLLIKEAMVGFMLCLL